MFNQLTRSCSWPFWKDHQIADSFL